MRPAEENNRKVPGARQRLMRSAAKMFQSHGYFAVSTAALLEDAKTPRGSLYHHFPSGKSELAIVTLDWLVEEIITALRSARNWAGGAGEIIPKLPVNVADWLEVNDWSQGSLLSVLAQETAETAPEIYEAVQNAYRLILSELADLIEAEGRPRAVSERLAHITLSLLEGATTIARTERKRTAPDHASNLLADLITVRSQKDAPNA